ncbi:MAG: YihA family ribosome biogenesis GTP-binding protein [Acidobacteria bacterium]|nr:YihA family ribosome biogenesis GTP-binding protein [Acidobacteriota bacterium]
MPIEFTVSAGAPAQFPRDRLPEVAFVGRSNVGKSSLLNALASFGRKGVNVDRKQLAFVSSTPGRTQTINFYKVDNQFYLVDLPGYGFAKAPRKVIDQWRNLADAYLTGREQVRLVVVIVDGRHGPKSTDEQMKEWLVAAGVPFLVVASKIDKLKKAQRAESVRTIEESFYPPLAFSAVTGEGVPELWDAIRRAIEH